jgi:hypothetical protein
MPLSSRSLRTRWKPAPAQVAAEVDRDHHVLASTRASDQLRFQAKPVEALAHAKPARAAAPGCPPVVGESACMAALNSFSDS